MKWIVSLLMFPGLCMAAPTVAKSPAKSPVKVTAKAVSAEGLGVTDDNWLEISRQIAADEKLGSEEIDLFTRGLGTLVATKQLKSGMTVGEVIRSQRMRERQNSATMLLTSVQSMEFARVMKVSVGKCETKEAEGKLNHLMDCQLQNTGKRDIAEVHGFVEILDPKGTVLKRIKVGSKNAIPAGKVLNLSVSFPHNPENQSDLLLKEQLPNLRKFWKPSAVTFADGSALGSPQAE